MQSLTSRVFVETGFQGCNTSFVVTDEGLVMIDAPQCPTDAMAWRQEMARRGELRYVINTEYHIDHTLGNFFFSAPVVASAKTREYFLAFPPTPEDARGRIAPLDPSGLPLLDSYAPRPPSIAFSQQLQLHLGRHTMELLHLPGHTPGQTAVFIPQERVVCTGDNVVYRSMPYMANSLPRPWLDSLKTIAALEVDWVVPGHGEVCDRSYLAEEAALIQEWLERVGEALDRGWSPQETAERISFRERYLGRPGWREFNPEWQRMNTLRVYQALREERG
ncbi:MAG: MBL fold metallo-hydrolase [Chloroflexi bacterium]|nr:MBL fold metallo-hydrolase [Chloroflexota bacterium]